MSPSALHLCDISWKYLWQYQSYRADTNDWNADGRMDGGVHNIPIAFLKKVWL